MFSLEIFLLLLLSLDRVFLCIPDWSQMWFFCVSFPGVEVTPHFPLEFFPHLSLEAYGGVVP